MSPRLTAFSNQHEEKSNAITRERIPVIYCFIFTVSYQQYYSLPIFYSLSFNERLIKEKDQRSCLLFHVM